MSGIVEVTPGESGLALDGYIRNSSGQLWNGSTFETFSLGNLASYANAFTEQAAMGYYTFTFPASVPAGLYSVQIKKRTGASPAQDDLTVGSQTLPPWDGDEFESGWSTPSRELTPGSAPAPVDPDDALTPETIAAQLAAVQSALMTALASPSANWSVGDVRFDQSSYIKMLSDQRDSLIDQLRSFPSESIDTVQNGVGVLGHDSTEYIEEDL